jgi:hypothetical protein
MMTIFKFIGRRRLMLFSLLMVICFSFTQIALAYSGIDTKRVCSVEINYQDNGTPIKGASFQLYHVANINDDDTIELTDDFAESSIAVEDLEDSYYMAGSASTLESYILVEESKNKHIDEVADGVTDSQGKTNFTNLETGIYLLVGDSYEVDDKVYKPADTLVTLPTLQDDNTLDYDPTIYPKESGYEAKPNNPDNPDNTDENPFHLSVQKIWSDNGYSNRPISVTVILFKDGKEYDKVVLNKDNNWRYKWENLDEDADWNLSEDNVPSGYTVTSIRDGNTFVVTNKRHSSGGGGSKYVTNKTTEETSVEATTDSSPDNSTDNPDKLDDSDTQNNPDNTDNQNNPNNSENPSNPNDLNDTPSDSEDNPNDMPNNPDNPSGSTPIIPPGTPINRLPQTGQLWWPIPLLLICGLALFMIGVKVNGGKNNEE